MRRLAEFGLIFVVTALLGWFLGSRPAPQKPPSPSPEAGCRYLPEGPPLAFNGVKPGDRVAEIEVRLGPPDFRNPTAHFQQWERPLTQISYSDQGVITEVAGSGRGVLTQGDRVLLRCGDEEEVVARVFGPAHPVENLYRFILPAPAPRVEIHCGSQSADKSWVSHISLNLHP